MKIINNKFIKFVIVLLLFFFGALFQLIPIKIFNIDINNISANTNIYLTIFSNTIIIIILIFMYKNDLINDIKKFKDDKSNLIDFAFKYWVLGLIFMALFNILISVLTPAKIANNEEAIRTLINVNPSLMFISTVLIAPFIEEMIFRKSFRAIIKNGIIYVLISGTIFGALHVVGSATTLYDYLYILPYSSLGISFSYIYYKTDNIVVPIITHMFHNTIMTLMTIFLSGMIL